MRIRKIILALALLLVFAGCGEDEKQVKDPIKEEAQEIEENKSEEDKKAEDANPKDEDEEADKNALEEAKNKAIEELTSLEFLDAKNIVDFTGKIKASEDAKEIGKVVEEAKKFNDDLKKTKVEADKLGKFYQKAWVINTIDGDTIEVQIGENTYKLRLIGMNTPETHHPNKGVEFYGKEAYEFTQKTLKNKEVYLEKDVSETDKYQRLLRYVWLSPPKDPENPTYDEVKNQSLNGILVHDGYANAATFPPDVKYADYFNKIEEEARSENKGLWNEKARAIWEGEKNSPENKWVRTTKQITNRGKTYTADTTQGPVKGNRKSRKYHVQGQQGYDKISINNVVWFNTKQEAEAAGYVPAKR